MPHSKKSVPVSMGSGWSRCLDVHGFRVTEARFPPCARLEPHTHGRALVAVMLSGSFESRIAGRVLDCSPAACWTEPCEEKHSNVAGPHGAHVIVIEADHTQDDVVKHLLPMLETVQHALQPLNVSRGWRIAGELESPDALTPLALEAAALDIATTLARVVSIRERGSQPPAWLRHAREVVDAGCCSQLTLQEIASAVGVHPVHLANTFKRYFHVSISEYARVARLHWAVVQLVETSDAIASIALNAGFTDQSHFTRACTARLGRSPARIRRDARTGTC